MKYFIILLMLLIAAPSYAAIDKFEINDVIIDEQDPRKFLVTIVYYDSAFPGREKQNFEIEVNADGKTKAQIVDDIETIARTRLKGTRINREVFDDETDVVRNVIPEVIR